MNLAYVVHANVYHITFQTVPHESSILWSGIIVIVTKAHDTQDIVVCPLSTVNQQSPSMSIRVHNIMTCLKKVCTSHLVNQKDLSKRRR